MLRSNFTRRAVVIVVVVVVVVVIRIAIIVTMVEGKGSDFLEADQRGCSRGHISRDTVRPPSPVFVSAPMVVTFVDLVLAAGNTGGIQTEGTLTPLHAMLIRDSQKLQLVPFRCFGGVNAKIGYDLFW